MVRLNSNLTASDNVPFRFGKTSDGKYGYILTDGGADTVVPFKSGGYDPVLVWLNPNPTSNFNGQTITLPASGYTMPDDATAYLIVFALNNTEYNNHKFWYHLLQRVVSSESYYIKSSGYHRKMTIPSNVNSIVFENAFGSSQNNSVFKPVAIYAMQDFEFPDPTA